MLDCLNSGPQQLGIYENNCATVDSVQSLKSTSNFTPSSLSSATTVSISSVSSCSLTPSSSAACRCQISACNNSSICTQILYQTQLSGYSSTSGYSSLVQDNSSSMSKSGGKGSTSIDQSSSSTNTRQNSPQHKVCIPRVTKVIQGGSQPGAGSSGAIQIPIYLNEAQLSLLNSKQGGGATLNGGAGGGGVVVAASVTSTTTPSANKLVGPFLQSGGGVTTTSIPTAQLIQHLHAAQQQQQHEYNSANVLHDHPSTTGGGSSITIAGLSQVAGGSNATTTGGSNNPNTQGGIVSYLIPPNLLVSHNQLSQLHPRDLAIIQQKLLHQQHLYQQHQGQQITTANVTGGAQGQHSQGQQLLCTCPSELHRAMHAQQQQQQQKLLEQRRLIAALQHGSTLPAGLTGSGTCTTNPTAIKIGPIVTASTLPRDGTITNHNPQHMLTSNNAVAQGTPGLVRGNLGMIGTTVSTATIANPSSGGGSFLCQNHQASLQRQLIESIDNHHQGGVGYHHHVQAAPQYHHVVGGVAQHQHARTTAASTTTATTTTGAADTTDSSVITDNHTGCVLNNSSDSGYGSNKEQTSSISSDVDSQISNIFTWIENVYGVKITDYISRNYYQGSQVVSTSKSASNNTSDKSKECNGIDPEILKNPQKLKRFLNEFRKELDDIRILSRRQFDFVKDSIAQMSHFMQSHNTQQLSDRIKLYEYNQAVLAHKIQTVQTSLTNYLGSDEKYSAELLTTLSRSVSDINDDFSKLQESYMMIEKPLKVNIDSNSHSIDKNHNILGLASKGMLSSQSQLNNLNHTLSDLLKKQSVMKQVPIQQIQTQTPSSISSNQHPNPALSSSSSSNQPNQPGSTAAAAASSNQTHHNTNYHHIHHHHHHPHHHQQHPQPSYTAIPEEASQVIVNLRHDIHRDILSLHHDLERRQSACELLDNYLEKKLKRHSAPTRVNEASRQEASPSESKDDYGTLQPQKPSRGAPAGIKLDLLAAVESNKNKKEMQQQQQQHQEENKMTSNVNSTTTISDLPPPPASLDTAAQVDDSPVPINSTDRMSNIDLGGVDSIPMIDETPSSESFDDVYFNHQVMLGGGGAAGNGGQVTQPHLHHTHHGHHHPQRGTRPPGSTILKPPNSSTSTPGVRQNKVVFCSTVTVEDGSEVMRLNCPSEESDYDESGGVLGVGLAVVDDNQAHGGGGGTLRRNPPPPPPPRRTSQNPLDGPPDLIHPGGAGVNNGPPRKNAHQSSSCENDVWQRQTEFNTTLRQQSSSSSSGGPPTPSSSTPASGQNPGPSKAASTASSSGSSSATSSKNSSDSKSKSDSKSNKKK